MSFISKNYLWVIVFLGMFISTASADVLDAKNVQKYFRYFSSRSHPETGMSLSHYSSKGQDPTRDCGARTYDMALRSIGEHSEQSAKIVPRFAQNRILAKSETVLQTSDMNYSPPTGVLNLVRVGCFDESQWWNHWEFTVLASDNAWMGLAAVYDYRKTKKLNILKFAEERADFLRVLQDTDGGIRMGPKGQHHSSDDKLFYWNHKSTESNASVLAFLDELHKSNDDPNIKKMADDVYEWLVVKMYSPSQNMFHRGSVFQNDEWNRDPLEFFSPDTVTWLPLQRFLLDDRFGDTEAKRLDRYAEMLEIVKKKVGVFQGPHWRGISFSSNSAENNIISMEWSSRLALRHLRVAKRYQHLGQIEDGKFHKKQHDILMQSLGGYFKTVDGALVAPYAVFPNGDNAAGLTTDQGWIIPDSDAAVSNVYYAFALSGFDPIP